MKGWQTLKTSDPVRRRAGDGLTALALLVAAAFPIRERFEEYGWLSMALGPSAPWVWLAVVAWIASVFLAIRWRGRWWLLLTAPIVFYPAYMVGVIIVGCTRGACL